MKIRIYHSSVGATFLGIFSGLFLVCGVLGIITLNWIMVLVGVAGFFLDGAVDKLANKKDLEKIKTKPKYAFNRFMEQKTLETKSTIIRMNPDIQNMVREKLQTYWVCPRCLALNEKSPGSCCRDCNTPMDNRLVSSVSAVAAAATPKEPENIGKPAFVESPARATTAAPVSTTTETDAELFRKPRLKSTMDRS